MMGVGNDRMEIGFVIGLVGLSVLVERHNDN